MTLNTRIWLHGPIHGRAAFQHALTALLVAADRADEIATAEISEQPAGSAPAWMEERGGTENGLTCTTLHAKALILLHAFISECGDVTLTWQNEYTGEIFEGLDGLPGFLGGGDEAMDWFNNLVKPAIESQYPDIQWTAKGRVS